MKNIIKKNPKVVKSFRLEKETIEILKNIAKENDCSMTTVIEYLINKESILNNQEN